MILKMISQSFEQCDFDFQITTSKMILILKHLYLGDLILILKSSTYDDFAHLWLHNLFLLMLQHWCWIQHNINNYLVRKLLVREFRRISIKIN